MSKSASAATKQAAPKVVLIDYLEQQKLDLEALRKKVAEAEKNMSREGLCLRRKR